MNLPEKLVLFERIGGNRERMEPGYKQKHRKQKKGFRIKEEADHSGGLESSHRTEKLQKLLKWRTLCGCA